MSLVRYDSQNHKDRQKYQRRKTAKKFLPFSEMTVKQQKIITRTETILKHLQKEKRTTIIRLLNKQLFKS